jgi:thiol-disulfide isomerase/thioredoxin
MRVLVMTVLLTLVGCPAPEPTTPIAPPAASVLAQIEASRDLDGAQIGTAPTSATIVVLLASWCEHCKAELPELAALRDVRVVAVNYRGHEEYDHRGSSDAIRAFAKTQPWLRIVPIGEELFSALGRPPLIPTVFVFDRAGTLVHTYDRRERTMPDRAELAELLAHR